jgi:hypothetical protein
MIKYIRFGICLQFTLNAKVYFKGELHFSFSVWIRLHIATYLKQDGAYFSFHETHHGHSKSSADHGPWRWPRLQGIALLAYLIKLLGSGKHIILPLGKIICALTTKSFWSHLPVARSFSSLEGN